MLPVLNPVHAPFADETLQPAMVIYAGLSQILTTSVILCQKKNYLALNLSFDTYSSGSGTTDTQTEKLSTTRFTISLYPIHLDLTHCSDHTQTQSAHLHA